MRSFLLPTFPQLLAPVTPVARPALVAACVTLLAAPASAQLPTVDQVLRRNLEALGGAEAVERVRSLRIVRDARTVVHRTGQGVLVELVDREGGGMLYAEGFDGETAWEQLPEDAERRVVTGRPQVALWHTIHFPSVVSPLATAPERGHRVEVVGREAVDGTSYVVVALTLSDGFRKHLYLHPDTWRIERERDRRRFHAYEEDQKNIEVVLGDFRRVDGVVIPFSVQERDLDTGEILGSATFLEVAVNASVPADAYSVEGSSDPARLVALIEAAGG